MSASNINELPPEILTKVFRYLDAVNLKNATLSCKLWNNLIESACRWSLKLMSMPFHYFLLREKKKMDFILTTNRKFGTIKIVFIQTDDHFRENDQITKVFQRHGLNVVKLCLVTGLISSSFVAFTELLNLTPNMEHVVMNNIILSDVSDLPLNHAMPQLRKLKRLELTGDQRIIKCFQKAQLTTVIIVENEHSTHHGQMIDFLISQDMLTSLTIEGRYSKPSTFFEIGELKTVPFRLTQLAISVHVRDHTYFVRFIETQAKSLEKLKIESIQSSVYEHVVANMTRLNHLSALISELPRGNYFHYRLKENFSVRTIQILNYSIPDVQPVAKFLERLPNIRHLILLNSSGLVAAAQNINQLESLSIGNCKAFLVVRVKFPNLKVMRIKDLDCKMDWNEFTKAHPLLTELTIQTMRAENFLTSADINQITTNVDLHHIKLGVGFVADDRFFEIIRANCTNLEVLELHKSCISHGLKQNVKIKVLRKLFKFYCFRIVNFPGMKIIN